VLGRNFFALYCHDEANGTENNSTHV
jgi:hypothetical protein